MSSDLDLLEVYLADVRNHDLLTAEEEVHLAQVMEKGERAKRLLAKGNFKPDDTTRRELSRRSRVALAAKDKFLAANLRLVVNQARKLSYGSGMEFLDLIQAGNIGLIRAVEKWDWRRGTKFSTYAVWWIRQTITREIMNHSNTIRIPVHIWDKVDKYKKIYNKRYSMTGEQPTEKQMSCLMELPLIEIRRIQVEVKRVQNILDNMKEWSEILDEPSPLIDRISQIDDPDNPIIFQERYQLVDYLEDPDSFEEINLIEERIFEKQLQTCYNNLPSREKHILSLRFGLNGYKPHTLAEIGSIFGLTRERIRQLEKIARSRLAHPATGVVPIT